MASTEKNTMDKAYYKHENKYNDRPNIRNMIAIKMRAQRMA